MSCLSGLPYYIASVLCTRISMCNCGIPFHLSQCSLQRPEYQHYRQKFATARSIDTFEKISNELKSLLLVSKWTGHHRTYSVDI